MAASRAIAVDSEIDGIPARPSSAETSPSCMTPLPDSDGSSSCSASTRPARRWYCSAWRMTPPGRAQVDVWIGEGGEGVPPLPCDHLDAGRHLDRARSADLGDLAAADQQV